MNSNYELILKAMLASTFYVCVIYKLMNYAVFFFIS